MPILKSPLISPEELVLLQNSSDLIVIDARAGNNAKDNYTKEHLKGARYVDLNSDLATVETDPSIGGRHPLPSFQKFAEVLSRLGITPANHIIVYDDKNGSNAAARFWWMLRAIGHQKIQVLNGGLPAAIKIGFPVSNEKEFFKPSKSYPITTWKLPLATIEEVQKAQKDTQKIIIDVRDKNRFDGLTEPLDLIAGHIPGAINIPFSENLEQDGFYKSAESLAAKYSQIIGTTTPENIIIHCGSGVTACHSILAIDYAGLPIPKLYVGSWSEWSRNNLPMITSEI